jgi:hypothetical protein
MIRKERIPEFEIPRPELKVETQKNSISPKKFGKEKMSS